MTENQIPPDLTPARSRRPMPAWKGALFAAVVFLFTLALIETAIRLLFTPIEVRGPFERPPEQITNRDVSVFQSDPLLFWRLRSNVQNERWDFTWVSTNDLGLRYGPVRSKSAIRRETGRPVFRILCVGDSVTFGYRVPDGSTFPAVLEHTLNDAFPSHVWEVIPLACPGYSSLQSLEHLSLRIREFDPDFLILNSGWNDIQIGDYPDKLVFEESQAVRSIQGWMRHSQTYLRLRHWLLDSNPSGQKPASERVRSRRVSVEDFGANFQTMVALGQKHGAPSLVLNNFYQKIEEPNEEIMAVPQYRAALAEACDKNQIPYLSIPFLTEAGWPDNRKFFGEPVHPGDAGHYLIARLILVWMLENNALPLDESEKARAEEFFAVYGSLDKINFFAEMRQSFKPQHYDEMTSGPIALGPPPDRGLRRFLFQDYFWQGPLLHVEHMEEINHLPDEWKEVEWRPLVPPYSSMWDGWLMIPEAGEWGIGTSSDDGSFVYIDGKLWLDNGGVHGPGVKLNWGHLDAGPHRLSVWYFDVGYGAEMRLLWARPNEEAKTIPAEAFRRN